MIDIVARRILLETTTALVRTNAPTPEHYAAVQEALAAVASSDFGAPLRVALMAAKKPAAESRPA